MRGSKNIRVHFIGGAILLLALLLRGRSEDRSALWPIVARADAHAAADASHGLDVDGNSDILPIVSIGDAAVVEGHSGTKPMVFTVTLKSASAQTVTVSYKTAKDTALPYLDYVQTSGLLTFAPGEVQKTVTVYIIGDVLFERDEVFYVTLINAQNALVGDWVGRGTIIDDDYGLFLPVVVGQP